MQIISMLFFPALLLLSAVLRGASAQDSARPTFEHVDRVTGETVTCEKCPPGTHMAEYCSTTAPTKCAPCKPDHYTELWNYLPRCLYCNNFCSGNQEVERECSPTESRTCRCKEGFYMASDYCFRHTECEPGSGVKTKGTSRTNTVCEECPSGYFSNTSSTLDACVKHQECASGQIALYPSSVNQDTMCGTCEDLAEGGQTLRTFLSSFFSLHRMRVVKMKNFVNMHITDRVPKQRGPLVSKIKSWLAQAPEQQLWNLSAMLKDAGLDCMAEKLENRYKEIKEQSPGCRLPQQATPQD